MFKKLSIVPTLMILLTLAMVLAIAPTAAHAATPTVTLTWNPVTSNVDTTIPLAGPVTYNVYTGAAGAETQLKTGLTAALYILPTTPAAGQTVCAQVTAVVQGVESAKSNEACGTIQFPTPGSPTVVVITIK